MLPRTISRTSVVLGLMLSTPPILADISYTPIVQQVHTPAPVESSKLLDSLAECIALSCAKNPGVLNAFVRLGYRFEVHPQNISIGEEIRQVKFFALNGPTGMLISQIDPDIIAEQGNQPKAVALALKTICIQYDVANRTSRGGAPQVILLGTDEGFIATHPHDRAIKVTPGTDQTTAILLSTGRDILTACSESAETTEILRDNGLVLTETPSAFDYTLEEPNGIEGIRTVNGYTLGTAEGTLTWPEDCEMGRKIKAIIERDTPHLIEME